MRRIKFYHFAATLAIMILTLGGFGLVIQFAAPASAAPTQGINDNNMFKIARGLISGASVVNKAGANADVATSFEPLWDGGGDYTYSSSAELMNFSSSNAGDTQDYTVYGCDGDYVAVSQQITMVGQTETAMTQLMLRVWEVTNDGATPNAGDVYIYSDDTVSSGVPQTASKIRAKILIGNNKTLMALYTIPDGKTGYLMNVNGSSGADQVSTFRVRYRAEGGVFWSELEWFSYRQVFKRPWLIPLELAGHTDFEISALASTSTDAIGADFTLILIDD